MTTFDATNAAQGFSMNSITAVDFSSVDATGGVRYSYFTDDGHDIELLGSGFTYSGGGPTGGNVTSADIDLNNDNFASPDISITGIPNGDLAVMTNNGSSGNTPGFYSEMLGGDDDVIGSAFADTLKGLGGADDIVGGGGSDSLIGDAGDDTLTGGTGNDTLTGGAGADLLVDDSGADSISGGDDDDYVQANSIIAADFFDGGAGTGDTIDWSGSGETGAVFDLVGGTATKGINSETMTNFENLKGTGGADHITGTAGANFLSGLGGNDTILAGDGDDSVVGGDGDDLINGGSGHDTLDGGAGNDWVDYAHSGFGGTIDLAAETADFPTFFVEAITSFENATGSQANDTISGTTGDNKLFGQDGNDKISGLGGNDTLAGQLGNDTLGGGGGDDKAFGNGGDDKVNGGSGNDTLTGSAGADTINGGADSDEMFGNADNDKLVGEAGNDKLVGLDGDDQLFGGLGDDTLKGGTGNDTMQGGGGADRFVFEGGTGADVVNGFSSAQSDVVELHGFGAAFDDFTDVQAAASQVGGDTVIDLGGGNSVTLTGILVGDLSASDFIFT